MKLNDVLQTLLNELDRLKVILSMRMTTQQRLHEVAVNYLGTDVTPLDEVDDVVACAEVVSTLIRKVLPDFPREVSTVKIEQRMASDIRFKKTLHPQAGTIIVSATKGKKIGHVGIFDDESIIMSNNSFDTARGSKGAFTRNYTHPEWIRTFHIEKGLRISMYDVVG